MAKKQDDDDTKVADLLGDDAGGNSATVASQQLRSIIERYERLDEEKKTISDDQRELMAEAKGNGFDTKAIRTIIKLRKKDAEERKEEEAVLDLYMNALGMV